MTIHLIETGRDGALTTYRVTGAAHLADDFYTDMIRIDGNDFTGKASKSDMRKIRNWVSRQNATPAIEKSTNQNISRVLVPAGKYYVGDTISGRTIIGLGRDFYPNVDQFSVAGLSPDYTGTVQYAYFD